MSHESPEPREAREHRALRATYRVQLHAGFPLDAAAALADYLAALGISHLYCSPVLQAAPGSTHGYDVVDPSRVNAALGGEPAYARLREALEAHGLGQVLDIVPNHMAIAGRENAWWWDVLENGPSSRYSRYFDVDWDPPEAKLRDTVLMPILGEHYGRVVESGQLQLAREDGAFILRYFDAMLPVAPRSLDLILAPAAAASGSDELAFLADAFARLPAPAETETEDILRRHRDKELLRSLLAALVGHDAAVAAALDARVAAINSDPALLDDLLERQNYRLTYWRAAERELDYRRFFDINSLAALRMEDERVFAAVHALPLRWLADGTLDGLRVDHVDGLRDPATYLDRLRERAPGAWIVVEKILEPGERLPATWPVAGTTGYDFAGLVSGLYVNPAAEEAMTALYADFTGQPTDYAALVHEKKLLALRETLTSDVSRLSALWHAVCQRHRRYRDYTRHELHDVLREVLACFPVYRTYVQAETGAVREEDLRIVAEAVEAARRQRPDLDADLFAFLSDLLLLRVRGGLESELAMRFQQLSGPAMAKGVEDTAFYCYNRLVALNEVGGDPGRFGTPVETFHTACASAQVHWPQTLLATSTHDTKRSEDVRARISLLSEIPGAWAEAVRRWSVHNERHRRGDLPDRNAEYLLYQTLVGAWPLSTERALAYMEKAAREAKMHTSWTQPNAEYEQALRGFVEGALADEAFTADVAAFVAPLVAPGWVNALSQSLLKLTAPGVPDIYQGTELWDLSLVDPDNRRPVDYDLRRHLLAELDGATPETIWERRDEGLPNLWLLRQALRLRAERPQAFGPGSTYTPLPVRGAKAAHAVAFARGDAVVALAPRLIVSLSGNWDDTTLELPAGRWRNMLTGDVVDGGGAVAVGELLRRFPVALLASEN